jgi:hypothetical protein
MFLNNAHIVKLNAPTGKIKRVIDSMMYASLLQPFLAELTSIRYESSENMASRALFGFMFL